MYLIFLNILLNNVIILLHPKQPFQVLNIGSDIMNSLRGAAYLLVLNVGYAQNNEHFICDRQKIITSISINTNSIIQYYKLITKFLRTVYSLD